MKRVDVDALDGLMVDPDAERTGHVGVMAAAAVAAGPPVLAVVAAPLQVELDVTSGVSLGRVGVLAVTFLVAGTAGVLVSRSARGPEVSHVAVSSPAEAPSAVAVPAGAPVAGSAAARPGDVAAAAVAAPAVTDPTVTRPEVPVMAPTPVAARMTEQAPRPDEAPVVAAPAPAGGGGTPAAGPWQVHFAFDAALPQDVGVDDVLREAASCFGTVIVTGHTCDIGDFSYNVDLARRRASEVAQRLERLGVPRERIQVEGAAPQAAPTPDARRDLRRVDITCLPTHER